MRLTDEQKHVIREVLKFPKNEMTIGGRAGCGKTTVIKHLIEMLPKFAVCAYTGKAANVLRRKGVEAKTIHSLIYKAYTDENNKVFFSLASSIDYEGIIVDEASMVSEAIYRDLKYFNKPIIFVGDHGQLEPVGDKFNLMSNPDYKLETIHRNAGEIAHFAEFIRQGYRPSGWWARNGTGGKVQFVPKNSYRKLVIDADQTICAYNKTRAELNLTARDMMGMPSEPIVGDRVMCLRNNSQAGLFNGMQGTIGELFENDFMLFSSDDHQSEVCFDREVFGQVKYDFDHDRDSPMPFDYCYATTCHKCQGSQYDSVLVMEQRCDLWDHKRWAYSAASRAINKLYWCEF